MKLKLKNKGQTIIEIVMAMSLLAIVLTGAVVLMINISNYGSSSEARSLAVNYAQEAMDVVKNIRDNKYCNFFGYANANYDIRQNVVTKDWSMLASAQYIPIFSPGSRERDATTSTLTPNGMQRNIALSNIPTLPPNPPNQGKRVTINIQWQTKGMPQTQVETYTIVTDMYRWKY